MPRADAGRGLLLRGDGQGNLTPVPGQQSGIKVYGEQRGCALSDYDHDGRIDLVVSQNAAPQNSSTTSKPNPACVSALKAPRGNKDMVGAKLRLKFGPRLGPLREIQCGSGYWSQNSPVQILATPEPPTELLVQLPVAKWPPTPSPPNQRNSTRSQRPKIPMRTRFLLFFAYPRARRVKNTEICRCLPHRLAKSLF